MVDGKRFRSALTRHLYEVLREEGFIGSGTALRRERGGVVHCFKLESDGQSGWCHINLGAHFEFLPNTIGQRVPLRMIHEINCAFRDRIYPPTGVSRGWVYLDDPNEIAESVDFIVSEWRTQGQPFFARYAGDTQSLERLLSEPRPRHLLADDRSYICIALHLGQRDHARTLIDAALSNASPGASLLIADLHELRSRAR